MSKIEDSASNIQVSVEDDIQPVNNNEESIAEDDECQLLLNISIDKIMNDSSHSLNSEDSFSSSSSAFQMTLMEKFNYIATRILYSKGFQYYYFIIIILSTIAIILSYLLECTNKYHLALEALIIIALIIEVTIRLLAQRKYFFYSFWNILDAVIIGVCVWLFYFTKTQCPTNDSIIDNSILVVRYLIQFIRLGILLKKNKSSGTNEKRKSVNFNQIRRKPTYGSFNPSSSFSIHRKGKRREIKNGEDKNEVDGEGNNSFQNISGIINKNIYNPYGSIDDSHNSNFYNESMPNESFISHGSNMLSQSMLRDYAPFLHESNGSIGVNIDSNANLARMFYQGDEVSGSMDSKKPYSISVNSVNDEVYQKLIHKNIENNNRNSSTGLPNAAGVVNVSESHPQTEKGLSHDSLSTNPIETPSSSLVTPSSFSYLKKPLPPTAIVPNPPAPQKSGSSSFLTTDTILPPKVGRKQSRVAQAHRSSTFSEIPSKVNLLTPILYGSPGTLSSNRN